MNRHIAIIEDEVAIRENYTDVFKRQGYRVDAYSNRPLAEIGLAKNLPQLAIIDIGLEDEYDGGLTLCQWLRQLSPEIAIIFLTARDSDIDIVTGLRLGADDYLSKTISLPHLSARIAALFRRLEANQQPDHKQQVINLNELQIDLNRMLVTWQQQMVEITVTEFWMLHCLVQNPGHVKSRDALMEDSNMVVDDATITSHIKRIRKKFQQIDANFNQIETVYGMGYRWKAQA
ncbi:proteobacterial dedicated sortase system response regulator [Catenovulum maritimum]|uniref:Chemotaxis protein CheY n=1 Tax=Catenovulum maritimum TaxID=1513271 RepID=A0A0J8JQM9_9ALTE|nr:proteobacterial dedicated sortase system response regulator [Catenovulum maritimum]KMT67021.1 chemotaxis protein CheY [Catenovulum maritimum]